MQSTSVLMLYQSFPIKPGFHMIARIAKTAEIEIFLSQSQGSQESQVTNFNDPCDPMETRLKSTVYQVLCNVGVPIRYQILL